MFCKLKSSWKCGHVSFNRYNLSNNLTSENNPYGISNDQGVPGWIDRFVRNLWNDFNQFMAMKIEKKFENFNRIRFFIIYVFLFLFWDSIHQNLWGFYLLFLGKIYLPEKTVMWNPCLNVIIFTTHYAISWYSDDKELKAVINLSRHFKCNSCLVNT